jgi:hypothetical protein
MTKKQHIAQLTEQLKEIADKFGIVLGKKTIVNWHDGCKEVFLSITELPSKNRIVRAMNAQPYIPMFIILNTDGLLRFDIDSYIALECTIDRFDKAAFKRLEHHITQNYEYTDLN